MSAIAAILQFKEERNDRLATMAAAPREVARAQCLLPDSFVGGSGSRCGTILLVSISGSVIVYRNELSKTFSIEWLVRTFTRTYATGSRSCFVNGIGAICRDVALSDGRRHMVAGSEELAS